MSKKRSEAQCFRFSDALHVVCGFGKEASEDTVYYTMNERYDLTLDTWESKTAHSQELNYFGAWTLDGKGHTIGGRVGAVIGEQVWTNSNVEYDPDTEAWTVKAVLPANEWVGMSFFEDKSTNRGYLVGGATEPKMDAYSYSAGGDRYFTERAYEYDPVLNSYTRKTDFDTDVWRLYQTLPGVYEKSGPQVEDEGMGPWFHRGAGSYNAGVVPQAYSQLNVPSGADVKVWPLQIYTPTTDSWEQQEYLEQTHYYNYTAAMCAV
jgi:hypothetical protein